MPETDSTYPVSNVTASGPIERPTAPQDRKPKKKGKKKAALKAEALGGTVTVEVAGAEWTVPLKALDDFELLEDLDAIDSGKGQRLPRALRRLLGDEQYPRALDAVRDEHGVVSVVAGAEFFEEILQALNPS